MFFIPHQHVSSMTCCLLSLLGIVTPQTAQCYFMVQSEWLNPLTVASFQGGPQGSLPLDVHTLCHPLPHCFRTKDASEVMAHDV